MKIFSGLHLWIFCEILPGSSSKTSEDIYVYVETTYVHIITCYFLQNFGETIFKQLKRVITNVICDYLSISAYEKR